MRLIDADALKERIGDLHFQNYGMALIAVCEAPTVDAAPVVHGHWDDSGERRIASRQPGNDPRLFCFVYQYV